MHVLPVVEFIDQHPIIDVRSPAEFEDGHIVGAVNLPIFSDEERAVVGTLYKQQGQDAAIDRGFELVGPKMRDLVEQARVIAGADKSLAVYCWRGGMRSHNMAALFEMAKLNCTVLDGGYKAYRKCARETYPGLQQLVVLAGPTGTGKTEILHALHAQGQQVIDLEGFANHRGSAFGAIGQPPQPTTEQFNNLVFETTRHLDPARPIWIESESRTIGKVYLEETLWEQMNQARIVTIAVDPAVRLAHIVEEYGGMPKADLAASVSRIERRLGGDQVRACVAFIENDQLEEAAHILLDYYDRSYLNSRKQHKKTEGVPINLEGDDPGAWAQQLIQVIN